MPVTHSPLRYPGGKTQLAPLVNQLIKINGLYQGVYVEPFAGGCGIAWELLLNGHASEVWINDLDPAIYAFWHSVLHQTEELCERIASTPITLDEWQVQRAVLSAPESDTFSRGFATLFLNRTNRSGILKGGVIGGLKQTGNYKLDCRFNRDELSHKIRRIARYRSVIRLFNMDAAHCLQCWDSELPPRALINIDPPYFAQGQALYLNYYKPKDHAQLANVVRGLKHPWMVTYDDEPAIESLYAGFTVVKSSLVYYAQVKRRARELMFFAPGLKTPDTQQRQVA